MDENENLLEDMQAADQKQDAASSGPDSTAKTSENQEQPSASKEVYDPKAWVEYVPKFTHKAPSDLKGCLGEYIDTINETLKVKELYKLAAWDQNINDAYYSLWVQDSNKLFKMAVMFKKRLSRFP